MYTSITNRGVSIKNKMIENYYILNQIVQSIDTGIVIIYERELLHINNEMRRITARTYKYLEHNLISVIYESCRRKVLKSFVSVLKEYSDKEDIYFEIVLPNESLKAVKCRFQRIKIFDKNGIMVSVHADFSEAKHDSIAPVAIKLWRKYRSEYEHILNKYYDFLIFIDNDYKIRNITKAVENVLKYKRTEFLDKYFAEVCNIKHSEELTEVLYGFQENSDCNRVVKNLKLTIIAKDNEVVRLSVSVFAVKIYEYLKGFCMVCTDMKNIDKSRLSADEVAANIAHEFRSPLNAIIGFSNILADETLPGYERKQYLNYIKQSCNSLLRVVNDFSDFNNLNHNKIVIHKDAFNINAVFDELRAYCSMFKKDYGKDNIQLIVYEQYPNQEVIVYGDRQRIFQVMVNLITNAFKYTEAGFVKYQYVLYRKFLVLKVSDSGIGITKENLGKIFNRLTQLDVNNLNKGSGLGLNISKNLVELMGGTITVNSEVGVGTEFLIKLPVGQPNEDNKKIQMSEDNNFDFTGKTIIVAEDAQINYILMEKILQKTNVKILWAKNGKECVELYIQHPEVSLILMDMQMPVMDGFEATKQILEINPDFPIIAQTAFSYSEEKNRILGIGCIDFIAKPIEKNLLYRKMAKAFGES